MDTLTLKILIAYLKMRESGCADSFNLAKTQNYETKANFLQGQRDGFAEIRRLLEEDD